MEQFTKSAAPGQEGPADSTRSQPAAPGHRSRRSRRHARAAGPFSQALAPVLDPILRRVSRWTPLTSVMVTAAAFLVLGWLQKVPCLRVGHSDTGAPIIDWSGNRQFTTACYNDQVALFVSHGLDRLAVPYFFSWESGGEARYMEYPVLSGFYQYAAAAVARPIHGGWQWLGLLGVPAESVYFAVSCVGLATCWLVSVALIAKLAGNRARDSFLMAASPLVIVHAFTNFDLLSVFFAVGCLAAWAQSRPALAGVLGGLGVAAKLWPAFILGAILLLCLRAKAWGPLVRMLVGAVVTWLAVNLPIAILAPEGWGEFFRLNSVRGWEGSTIYAVIAHMIGSDSWNGTNPSQAIAGVQPLNMITFALLAACLLALAVAVVFLFRTPPRLAQVAFLAVAAFMLTNKVWSPQYSIWLVPLIVVAIPRWRLTFVWATVEMVYWYLRMWQFLPANEAAPYWLVDTITLLRIGLILAMVGLIIRDMRYPERDVVRSAHSGRDPLAGNLPGDSPAWRINPRTSVRTDRSGSQLVRAGGVRKESGGKDHPQEQ